MTSSFMNMGSIGLGAPSPLQQTITQSQAQAIQQGGLGGGMGQRPGPVVPEPATVEQEKENYLKMLDTRRRRGFGWVCLLFVWNCFTLND